MCATAALKVGLQRHNLNPYHHRHAHGDAHDFRAPHALDGHVPARCDTAVRKRRCTSGPEQNRPVAHTRRIRGNVCSNVSHAPTVPEDKWDWVVLHWAQGQLTRVENK